MPIERLPDGTVIITGQTEIEYAAFITRRQGIKLEMKGLTKRGKSMNFLVKREYNLPPKWDNTKTLAWMDSILAEVRVVQIQGIAEALAKRYVEALPT